MELKEITTALYDWAGQDSEHRNVVCIATEGIGIITLNGKEGSDE